MEDSFTALLLGAIAFLIPLLWLSIMAALANPFVRKEVSR